MVVENIERPMTLPATACQNEVLVVDDNPAILNLVARLVRSVASLSVRCFESPVAALRAFGDSSQHCRMVISDFDMPGMNGADLLREMARRRPELPMVLFSGSAEEEIVSSKLPSQCQFLSKPGGIKKLIEMIQALNVAG